MDSTTRPLRSLLYIPASKARALEKARQLAADAIIFDLEDAVAPDEKAAARALLGQEINAGGYGARMRIVRINALSTEWGADDAAAVLEMGVDAVLLPKVGGAGDLDALAQITGVLPIWAMMETPRGMLAAAEIAAHPLCQGMVMGTNDLAKEMGTRFRADRLPLIPALGLCVLAAKAEDIAIIDGVYNAFRDAEGLARECEQGCDMGFDGKTLIHPAQLDVANAVFSPSPEGIDLAHRQIAAYEDALAEGQAVAVVDGQIVENLHVAIARKTLAKMNAIDSLGTE
ncbi:(3S)-malyl-CoA thioesterase [Roseobacter fucihabitans]|uniref:(3S)-malyl-CoA thioesterase n=1 Tax=Roseobacter fucihabitans TaxID=1537242 RepID=A0ABZ2BNY9_9RHOB|nr:CoA ester lyase [Roseobacter litoralis]MBC6966039.1 (3S)-malyl-CoA thioesterase [Roseobacter litoralis]